MFQQQQQVNNDNTKVKEQMNFHILVILVVVLSILLIVAVGFLIIPKNTSQASATHTTASLTSTSGSALSNTSAVNNTIHIFSKIEYKPYVVYNSSDGNFSMSIPQGWQVHATNGDKIIIASPQGSSLSSILSGNMVYIIAGVAVSDINYEVILRQCENAYISNPYSAPSGLQCAFQAISTQLQDSSYEWNATSALTLILDTLTSSGNSAQSSITSTKITSINNTVASYNIGEIYKGQNLDEFGYIIMAYIPNPMLSHNGTAGVTSTAVIAGCQTPAGQINSSFKTSCARILQSFKPSENWFSGIVQNIMSGYQGEAQTLLQGSATQLQQQGLETQTIENFGKNMMQMQNSMFSDFQNSNYVVTQDWSAALSNHVNLIDPNTGQTYTVPGGYSSYCLSATGDVLAGQNIRLGEGPTYDSCVTPLK